MMGSEANPRLTAPALYDNELTLFATVGWHCCCSVTADHSSSWTAGQRALVLKAVFWEDGEIPVHLVIVLSVWVWAHMLA